MLESIYLKNIPAEAAECGISKVLLVRREIIHIKHIFTEIFIRKSIDIHEILEQVDMSLFDYNVYMTSKIRRLHHLSRLFSKDPNEIVNFEYDRFFPFIEFTKTLTTTIALDFDGVVTSEKFKPLYELCLERGRVIICSANPTIQLSYFTSNQLGLPNKLYSLRGKTRKLNQLLDLNLKNDFLFYVDNEDKYLRVAWIFGIKTFLYKNGKIESFSLNTK